MKVGKENENVNLREMGDTLYWVRDRTSRDKNAKDPTQSEACYRSGLRRLWLQAKHQTGLACLGPGQDSGQ
jgi:hypothetical protein